MKAYHRGMNTMRGTQSTGHEEGSVLIIAMIILILVTLLGIAATTTSTFEIEVAGRDRLRKQVFYAAEAGIEQARAVLASQFAISNTPLIAAGQAPNWDFALLGSDMIAGGGDDATGQNFATGAHWLEGVPFGQFTYTVRVWNNNDGGGLQDLDAIIWVQSNATGPNGAAASIVVSLLGGAAGGDVNDYAQAGGTSKKTNASRDRFRMTNFTQNNRL